MKYLIFGLIFLILLSTVFSASMIQIRRDTAANWSSSNPVLGQGEPGFETDTLQMKYGNGVTAWTSLAYYATDSNITAFIDNYYNKTQSDANWVKYQLLGNYLTVAQGDANYWARTNNFITVAQADTNYYGKSVTDTNLQKYTLKTDFNTYLLPQTCPVGQALRVLGSTPTCIQVAGTDTNWQTSWSTFDTNMKNQYRLYAVDLNTSGRINSSGAGNNSFTGNVGIGTTAPSGKLHIQQASNNAIANLLYLTNSGTEGAGSGTRIVFRNSADYGTTYDSAYITSIEPAADMGGLTFSTYNSGTTYERMRIDNSGNVGIGTTTPSEKLHVNGNILINDNNKMLFGDAKDASITYTGTDLNINPKEVGTGAVKIRGNLKVDGNYYASDGTVGFTGTCTILGLTSIVVRNGLIVSCS